MSSPPSLSIDFTASYHPPSWVPEPEVLPWRHYYALFSVWDPLSSSSPRWIYFRFPFHNGINIGVTFLRVSVSIVVTTAAIYVTRFVDFILQQWDRKRAILQLIQFIHWGSAFFQTFYCWTRQWLLFARARLQIKTFHKFAIFTLANLTSGVKNVYCLVYF